MITASAQFKNVARVRKFLKTVPKTETKALQTAMKVEGFSLMKRLRQEIRHGAPGGRRFAPLSMIAARSRAQRLKGSADIKRFGAVGTTAAAKKRPLRRLASAVRYSVRYKRHFEMAVGWPPDKLSKSWVRIARFQQEGGSFPVTEDLKRYIRQVGIILKKRRDPAAKYFFLKKYSRRFRVPPRPILEPFWRAHGNRTWRNIERNWRRKAIGMRI